MRISDWSSEVCSSDLPEVSRASGEYHQSNISHPVTRFDALRVAPAQVQHPLHGRHSRFHWPTASHLPEQSKIAKASRLSQRHLAAIRYFQTPALRRCA